MSNESGHLSEDERISDLETTVKSFKAQFESLQSRISTSSTQLGFGVPLTSYPLFMPVVSLQGDPGVAAARAPGSSCFESVTTPMEGENEYKIVEPNVDCLPSSPAEQAGAVIDARKNLVTFGETWCAAGNANCNSNLCEPRLSGTISVTKYVDGDRPAPNNKKACFVTAFTTGTVSCQCK